MRPIRVGLGYGETLFLDGGHSTIDFQEEGYLVLATVLLFLKVILLSCREHNLY